MTRFFCSQFFNSQGILSSCIIAWLMWFFHQIHPLNMNHLKGNHSLEMGRRMNKNSLKLTFLHLKIDVWKTTCSLSFLEAQKAYFQRAMAYLGATFQGGQKPHPVPLKTGGWCRWCRCRLHPSLPPRICSAAHPRWFRNLGVDEKLHQAQRLEAGDVP